MKISLTCKGDNITSVYFDFTSVDFDFTRLDMYLTSVDIDFTIIDLDSTSVMTIILQLIPKYPSYFHCQEMALQGFFQPPNATTRIRTHVSIVALTRNLLIDARPTELARRGKMFSS